MAVEFDGARSVGTDRGEWLAWELRVKPPRWSPICLTRLAAIVTSCHAMPMGDLHQKQLVPVSTIWALGECVRNPAGGGRTGGLVTLEPELPRNRAVRITPLDIAGAAKVLGVSRRTLVKLLKAHPHYERRGIRKVFYPEHIEALERRN